MLVQLGVEVQLLELLADVVDGDLLRAFRPPDLVGDDDCSHVLVRQFDEGTFHERDVRRVIGSFGIATLRSDHGASLSGLVVV